MGHLMSGPHFHCKQIGYDTVVVGDGTDHHESVHPITPKNVEKKDKTTRSLISFMFEPASTKFNPLYKPHAKE